MRISDWSSDVCSSDLQLSFAHNFANQTIANYDTRNRPEIFQGWLGAPIGLFQSYITNYYSRMLRLFETHNTRALARDRKSTRLKSSHKCESRTPAYDRKNTTTESTRRNNTTNP